MNLTKIGLRCDRLVAKKISEFPEELKTLIQKEGFVAGGAIASLINDDKVNDLDIYFKSPEALSRLVNLLNTSDLGYPFELETYTDDNLVYRSDLGSFNAIHRPHKNDLGITFYSRAAISMGDVQLIVKYAGDPDKVVESFDFAHCQGYYDISEENLVVSHKALECLHFKHLLYTGSEYPVSAVFRVKKYLNRGYTISAGQLFKIAFEVSKLNLEDLVTLRDQLIGIDVMYFNHFLKALEKMKKEDKVDKDTIFTLIDTFFND